MNVKYKTQFDDTKYYLKQSRHGDVVFENTGVIALTCQTTMVNSRRRLEGLSKGSGLHARRKRMNETGTRSTPTLSLQTNLCVATWACTCAHAHHKPETLSVLRVGGYATHA